MTTRVIVLNGTKVQAQVKVNGPEGEKDVVFVQPGGRPRLLEGWTVDEQYLAENQPWIRTDLEITEEGV